MPARKRSRNQVRTGHSLFKTSLVVVIVFFSIAVLPAQIASAATQTVTNCNDSGSGSLRQAVLNATSGDTITFALSPACSTITLTSGAIIISDNLTVSGPGANSLAISGNEESDIFAIDASTVSISGLTIENGGIPGNINSDGGAISNNGTLTISNCTLADNKVQGMGGAIFNSFDTHLTLVNSAVLDNTATLGGAIATQGAFSTPSSTLTISGSELVGNDSSGWGGGISSTSTSVSISNSTIADNRAGDFGGGITADGTGVNTLTISDSNISDNTAGTFGGGIDAGPLTLTDSMVSDNSGGGVSGDPVTVNDSTISGNTGNPGLSTDGISTVSDSTVADNGEDGGVSFSGTLSLSDSTLWGNSATFSNGGGISGSGTLSIVATIVAASPSGGDCDTRGVTVNDEGDNLDDDGTCGFTMGSDHSDTPAGLDPTGAESNGGSTQTVALQPGSAAIDAIASPSLCSSPDQRGVVRPTPCDIGAYQSHFLTVTNCNDSGVGSLRQAVSTAAFGDSIDFKLTPACSTISLASPIGINTTVAIDGPGVSALAISGMGSHAIFSVPSEGTATVSGVTIEDGQTASTDGGGGIVNEGTLTVTFSALTDNAASSLGGGVSNLGSLTMVSSTVSGNTTGIGSGVSGFNGGGGIFNEGSVSLLNTTVSDNSTARGAPDSKGGGIANDGGYVAVTGSTLSDNHAPVVGSGGATGDGGGVWSDDGDVAFDTSTVSDNTTAGNGGGIDDAGGGIASLSESSVSGNSASAGGALDNNGSLWFVLDSTLSGNNASQGAGIDNSGDLAVTTSTLSGNAASAGQGGGVENSGLLDLTMSTVAGNSAPGGSGGGVANASGATADLAGTIVATNSPGHDCSGSITDAGYNLDDDASCGFSAAHNSQSGVALQLGPLQDNGGPTETQAPAYNSTAFGQIPVGTTGNGLNLCPGTDQRGTPRPQGSECDLGAVELPLGTQTITFTSTPPTNAVEGTTYTVSATGGGSGNPVTFSSGSPNCTIAGSTVTFVGYGTCQIEAKQAGDSSYQPAMAFQYVQVAAPSPSISGFRPSKGGRPGKKITILGANLYGPSQVSFNGTNATILSSTNTRVTTRVPRGATSGPITVTTPGGTAISGKVFTVK